MSNEKEKQVIIVQKDFKLIINNNNIDASAKQQSWNPTIYLLS